MEQETKYKSNLDKINSEYKNYTNKQLVEAINGLDNEFNRIKSITINLTEVLDEIQEVYNKIYVELGDRLNFNDTEQD